MSAEIVKTILESVLSRGPHKKNKNLCCVCFQIIVGEEKFSIQDEFEFAFEPETKMVESLGIILETIIGKSFTDVSCLLNSVCLECIDAVIATYKFILGVRENGKILWQVIDNLQTCFMDTSESMVQRCDTMYINIENDEVYSTFRRYYDRKSNENQKEALERINYIIKHRKPLGHVLLSEDEDVLDNDEEMENIEPSFQVVLKSNDKYKCPDCKLDFNSLQRYERHRNMKRKCTSRKRGCYQCAHCKYKAVYKHLLRYHIQLKHPETTSNDNVVCEECGKFFPNNTILKAHKLTHRDKKKIECHECGRMLKTKASLKNHMTIHTGEKKYSCKFCGKLFRNPGNRYDHIQRHHVKSDPTQCKICQKVYKNRQDYLKHKRKHFIDTATPAVSRVYQCGRCKFSAKHKYLLKKHIQFKHESTHHSNVCDKCGKKFPHPYTLKKHMETHVEWKFQCQVCNKKLKTEISLKNHMASHDKIDYLLADSLKEAKVENVPPKGLKYFNCPDCNAGFNSPELYKKHKSAKKPCTKWHRGLFPCNQCDYTAKYKTALKRHILQKHEGMVVTCEKCGKICRDKSTLQNHLLTHGEARFQCKECGQRLRSVQGLKNHMASHTGEKNYICYFCDKHFRGPTNLSAHIARHHTPLNPVQCDVCEKVFKCRPDYLKHRKKLHSELVRT